MDFLTICFYFCFLSLLFNQVSDVNPSDTSQVWMWSWKEVDGFGFVKKDGIEDRRKWITNLVRQVWMMICLMKVIYLVLYSLIIIYYDNYNNPIIIRLLFFHLYVIRIWNLTNNNNNNKVQCYTITCCHFHKLIFNVSHET